MAQRRSGNPHPVGNPNPSPSTRFSATRQPDGHKRPQELMRKLREMDAEEAPKCYEVLKQIRSGYLTYTHPETGTTDYERVPVKDRREAATSLLEWARGKPQQSIDVSGGLEVDLVGLLDEKINSKIGNILGGK